MKVRKSPWESVREHQIKQTKKSLYLLVDDSDTTGNVNLLEKKFHSSGLSHLLLTDRQT